MSNIPDIKETENEAQLELPQFASSQSELDTASKSLNDKWESDRYKHIKRSYDSQSIIRKRGALPRNYVSNLLANQLWKTLKLRQRNSQSLYTFTVINPIQAFHASRYLDAIVVSGVCASVNGLHFNEPSPGTADHSYDTIPLAVQNIFNFLEFHDRKQRELHGVPNKLQYHQPRDYQADYLTPIIADVDSGHGGFTRLMKMTRLLVEHGAAGISIDDQSENSRSASFSQGKILVPVSEYINRLLAIRAQLDILDCDQVIFGKTQAHSATLITSDIDRRDHPFILGSTVPLTRLTSILQVCQEQGADQDTLERMEQLWLKEANLLTYVQAVANKISVDGGVSAPLLLREWYDKSRDLTIDDQKKLALSYGVDIFWDYDIARTRDGHYRYLGGIEAAISRAINFVNYTDVVTLETELPVLGEAKQFADSLKSIFPTVMLGYILPSLVNWDNTGIFQNESELEQFNTELAKAGYVFQHLEMAGLEAQSLISELFSKDYKNRGIFAYIQGIQRPEIYYQIQTNYHHNWSGAEFSNRVVRLTSDKDINNSSYGQLFDKKMPDLPPITFPYSEHDIHQNQPSHSNSMTTAPLGFPPHMGVSMGQPVFGFQHDQMPPNMMAAMQYGQMPPPHIMETMAPPNSSGIPFSNQNQMSPAELQKQLINSQSNLWQAGVVSPKPNSGATKTPSNNAPNAAILNQNIHTNGDSQISSPINPQSNASINSQLPLSGNPEIGSSVGTQINATMNSRIEDTFPLQINPHMGLPMITQMNTQIMPHMGPPMMTQMNSPIMAPQMMPITGPPMMLPMNRPMIPPMGPQMMPQMFDPMSLQMGPPTMIPMNRPMIQTMEHPMISQMNTHMVPQMNPQNISPSIFQSNGQLAPQMMQPMAHQLIPQMNTHMVPQMNPQDIAPSNFQSNGQLTPQMMQQIGVQMNSPSNTQSNSQIQAPMPNSGNLQMNTPINPQVSSPSNHSTANPALQLNSSTGFGTNQKDNSSQPNTFTQIRPTDTLVHPGSTSGPIKSSQLPQGALPKGLGNRNDNHNFGPKPNLPHLGNKTIHNPIYPNTSLGRNDKKWNTGNS